MLEFKRFEILYIYPIYNWTLNSGFLISRYEGALLQTLSHRSERLGGSTFSKAGKGQIDTEAQPNTSTNPTEETQDLDMIRLRNCSLKILHSSEHLLLGYPSLIVADHPYRGCTGKERACIRSENKSEVWIEVMPD